MHNRGLLIAIDTMRFSCDLADSFLYEWMFFIVAKSPQFTKMSNG